jgi:hypothetical protein
VTRTGEDPVRLWAAMTALLFWAFPLFAGRGVSLYRADALVLPVLLLLVELPVWVLIPLLSGSCGSPTRWDSSSSAAISSEARRAGLERGVVSRALLLWPFWAALDLLDLRAQLLDLFLEIFDSRGGIRSDGSALRPPWRHPCARG